MGAITKEMLAEVRLGIRRRILSGERRVERLRSLLTDIEAAERVLDFVDEEPQFKEASVPSRLQAVEFSTRNPFRPGSNKAFIWEAMDYSSNVWLDTSEVQRLASELRGAQIPMSSVATTLSRMKGGALVRKGLKVALALRMIEEIDADPACGLDVGPRKSEFTFHGLDFASPEALIEALDDMI